MRNVLADLSETRDKLLQEYVNARKVEKADILSLILEIEEQMEQNKRNRLQ